MMRLTPAEIVAVRDTVRAVAGASVVVRLFGSRLDDTAKGGDIDLLIELKTPVDRAVRLRRASGRACSRFWATGVPTCSSPRPTCRTALSIASPVTPALRYDRA